MDWSGDLADVHFSLCSPAPQPPPHHLCPLCAHRRPHSHHRDPPPSTTTRHKQCPACLKSVASTSFGHINSQRCGEALTSAHLESIGYERCPIPTCQRILHNTRIQAHISDHDPMDVPTQPQTPSNSQVSSLLSASRSPSPVRAEHKESNDEHIRVVGDMATLVHLHPANRS